MKTRKISLKNMRIMFVALWVIPFLLIAQSCQQGSDRSRDGATTRTTWENRTNDTVGTTVYVRDYRQNEISEYESQFSQVEERIEIIRHRSDTVNNDIRINQHEIIGNLEQQRLQAEERLRELRRVENEDAWIRTEEELERTLNELELAVEQAENELD
jgi:TolA-binding protein